MINFVFPALFAAFSMAAAPADPSLSFNANFDAYSVKANFARGEASSRKFGEESLQLRMWPGAHGNVNSLAYSKSESCAYALKDNFDPRQGTVSFWVASLGWKPSAKVFQWFFTARQKGFVLHVYKYIWGEYLMFYIETPGPDGKPRRFTASARMADEDWAAGRWHKIDATWNSSGMKLYIDGVMPQAYRPSRGAPAVPKCDFPQPVAFPSATADGEIVINSCPTVKGAEKDERTAIDDLKVYVRALSADEIRSAYVKVVPSTFGAKGVKPVAGIPPLRSAVTLDGTIGEEEWADASRLMIANVAPFSKVRDTTLSGSMYLKRDDERLYLALKSDRRPVRAAHRERDGSLWEDDVFEIALEDVNRIGYHFIINANGAVYDERSGVKAWNSRAECRARCDADGWTAEFSVPLSDIGGVPLKGNVGLSSFSPGGEIECVGWAKSGGGGYVSPSSYGSFVRIPSAISILNVGSLASGDVWLSVSGAAKFTAFVEHENGDKTLAGAAFPVEPWKFTAAPGNQRLFVRAELADGRAGLEWEKFFYVKRDVEVCHDCHSREGFIEATAEFSGALAAAAAGRGAAGEFRLVSEDGAKVFAKCPVTARAATVKGRLKLPELPAGDYFVEAEFDGVKGRRKFRMPDLSALKRKVGLDGSVPPPWTVLERGKDGNWRVLDREYFFGASPFPERIVSRGDETFVSPPRLRLDGREIEWSHFRVTEEREDVVKFAGRGKCGNFKFGWKAELWFDGMYLVHLGMKGEGRLCSLALDYSVPRENARYVFKQGYRDSLFRWKGDRIGKVFDPKRHPENSLHWTSGLEKGFAFGCVSDANWANAPDEENVVLTREEKKVGLTAKIISREVEVKRPADWKFIFQATPSRRADSEWRSVNINGYFVPTMQNRQFGGYGEMSFADRRRFDRWTTPSSMKFRWPDWYLKENAKPAKSKWKSASHLPFKSLAYCMPMHIGTNEAEYDYFFHDAVKLPSLTWSFKEDGVAQSLYCVCDSRIWDIQLSNLEWFLKNSIPLMGVYNDCAHVKFCENERHGHGGLDAFGKSFSSLCWLEQREFFLREYRLMKKYGRNLRNHCPSADFVPFVMNFCDEVWTGEEFHATVLESLECYSELVPKESWQAAFNTVIRGVPFHLLSQYGRAAGAMGGGEAVKRKFNRDAEWAERTLAVCLVHDVPVSAGWIDAKTVDRWWVIKEKLELWNAKFIGYWFDGAIKECADGLLVSRYELPPSAPYRQLVVVSNFSRKDTALGAGELPGGGRAVKELWSGRDLSPAEIATLVVPAKKFVLLGVGGR